MRGASHSSAESSGPHPGHGIDTRLRHELFRRALELEWREPLALRLHMEQVRIQAASRTSCKASSEPVSPAMIEERGKRKAEPAMDLQPEPLVVPGRAGRRILSLDTVADTCLALLMWTAAASLMDLRSRSHRSGGRAVHGWATVRALSRLPCSSSVQMHSQRAGRR